MSSVNFTSLLGLYSFIVESESPLAEKEEEEWESLEEEDVDELREEAEEDSDDDVLSFSNEIRTKYLI